MTLSTTVDSLSQQKNVSKSGAALFNNLGIYHFCIAFFLIDSADVIDFLDFNQLALVKYGYAAIVLGFMAAYFLRWKTATATVAPVIFFAFFLLTGIAFAVNFFINDERLSYVSAFISPLVFSLAIFIPPNTVMLDARRITRTLTWVFCAGSVFYLIEAIVKRLDFVGSLAYLDEVQIHKSLTCVVALCLCILTGRGILGIFVAVVTIAALALRPVSTLVLALACCVPIAMALRFRVSRPAPVVVLIGRSIALTVLVVAVSIPLALYFFFDDIAPIIYSWEGLLKSDVIGGRSNVEFRLAILEIAFKVFDTTSFWYGSALTGSQTVPLALLPGWDWWGHVRENGVAPIHSDFVVVLTLTGIIGYIIFVAAFYRTLADRFRELARRNLSGNGVVLQAISIIGVVALMVYASDQPYLSYYNHAHSVWMLLLISEVARRSNAIGNAGRGGQALVSGYRR